LVMRIWQGLLSRDAQAPNGETRGSNELIWRRASRYAIGAAVAFALIAEFGSVSFAQRTSSTTSKRGFNLSGDVRVDESQAVEQTPLVLDVMLYTKGDQLVGRQRISPGGRYRFMDLFDGDYNIVVEVENKEVARVSLFIAQTSPVDLKQDITLEWRSTGYRSSSGSGVVSAADLYNRSSSNKSLYQKANREIDGKNYSAAMSTLLGLVAADPGDFPAWSDLGMLYFIQKDYEAAENSYASALKAKPDYFRALLSQGRVQLARKNYPRAIETLEAALKVERKSASANFFLGEAYLQVKKGSKAVGYLNEALTLDPVGMADAHLRLAALYNGAGMKDKAALEYEQFLKTKPDYPERKKLEEYISANKKQ